MISGLFVVILIRNVKMRHSRNDILDENKHIDCICLVLESILLQDSPLAHIQTIISYNHARNERITYRVPCHVQQTSSKSCR